MNWIVPSFIITGSVHHENGIEGQDYVKISLSNNVAIVVMTDGVGSARMARMGSRGVAKEVSAQLEQRGADLFDWKDTEIRIWLSNVTKEWLRKESEKLECKPRDLDTTLTVFISDGERYMAGSIGDGLVGRISDEEQEVILEPEHGESINKSYFIATSDFNTHFRIARGYVEPGNVYFLMTDGTCDCVYDYLSNTFTDAMHIFCEWTRKYERKAVQDAIFKVASNLFKKVTSDDCALALIYGKGGRFI